jgi:hypothetical protein
MFSEFCNRAKSSFAPAEGCAIATKGHNLILSSSATRALKYVAKRSQHENPSDLCFGPSSQLSRTRGSSATSAFQLYQGPHDNCKWESDLVTLRWVTVEGYCIKNWECGGNCCESFNSCIWDNPDCDDHE